MPENLKPRKMWCWCTEHSRTAPAVREVYDELTKRGFHVNIVQNPLTSVEDDLAATQRILDRQDGTTILVGHSWGGVVITEAGVHLQVSGLVYLSALSPMPATPRPNSMRDSRLRREFVLVILWRKERGQGVRLRAHLVWLDRSNCNKKRIVNAKLSQLRLKRIYTCRCLGKYCQMFRCGLS
jgi:pimeloyl-ACP methyl ester carboxylesterase